MDLDPVTSAFLRLLIYTGCRRSEIASAEWSQIDPDKRELTIPEEKSKNHRKASRAVIDCGLGGDRGTAPQRQISVYGPWRRASRWLRPHEASGRCPGAARQALGRGTTCAASTASGLQALDFSVELIEVILNHVSGTFRGVTGIYQRHDYAEEKRQALQAWADHLAGNRGEVIPLRGGRR